MRVLVCGSRYFADRGFVYRTLSALHAVTPFSVLIEGECPIDEGGVDIMARDWANENGVPVLPFPPEVGPDGHVLGPKRNAQMIREGRPDIVIAFPGGRGTSNMIKQAREAGIHVEEIEY